MTKRPLPVPTEPADIATLLHEAVVYGTAHGDLIVGRRRPFIPAGTDPTDVNRECARRYAARVHVLSGEIWIAEVDPADVVPFVDVAAQLEAADEHANRAQRRNRRGAGR